MAEPKPRPLNLYVEGLTDDQAYALAELCKRISWSDARQLAVNDDEARAIIAATYRVRSALEQIGVRVR